MTRVQEVMDSNPGADYWMDLNFFHIDLLLELNCLLKKTENKRKRGWGWPICKKFEGFKV